MKTTYSQTTLSNGLRVLHLPVENALGVHVSLVGKVGRRAELESEIGAAHFLEHLFFDGTQKRPSAEALSTFIDSYGAARNGTTAPETVEYWCKVLAEHAEVAFDYISDIVLNSKLEEIEKERKVIKQEALMNRDDVNRALERWHKKIIYPNQPVGRTIFDEEENLPHITKEVLQAYMERTYGAKNFVLVITGALSKEKAFALANQYFTSMTSGTEVSFAPASMTNKKEIQIRHQALAQSHFALSFPGYALGTDKAILVRLLALLLGNSSSSRLMRRLRHQNHLIYSVSASHFELSDTGYLQIVTSLQESNLQPALDEIKKEFFDLLTQGISEAELEKVKNLFLARTLFRLEDLAGYSTFFSRSLLFDTALQTPEALIKQVRSISEKDMLTAAHEVLESQPKLTIMTSKTESVSL